MKIELCDLVLERPGGIRAIDGISYEFDSGSCSAVAILGANGAGKSTLLESIPGLVPIRSGAVRVDGLNVEKRNLTAIRMKVGMIFQNSDDQLFNHTVREDVAFGPRNLKLPEEVVNARVQEALSRLGIVHLAERDVTHLSGGEKLMFPEQFAGLSGGGDSAVLQDETLRTEALRKRKVMRCNEF